MTYTEAELEIWIMVSLGEYNSAIS